MSKKKKIFTVLSTTVIAGLMVAAVNSTAFAKTTKIAVDSKDGKVYEYQYDALETSLLSQLIKGNANSGSKLYNDFLERKTTIRALYDDVKKSYVGFDTISKETTNAVATGKPFNLTSFMESPTTPTTTITTNAVSVNANGNLMINGQIADIKDSNLTIKSITIIDSETIRVRFSKDADYAYAHNISNYQLLDNNGIDISNHIRGIYSAVSESDTGNTDTYNIKLQKYNPSNANEDWRLTNSKYILTIKNIIDTSSTPNTMDDYTYILSPNDITAPKITGIYSNLRTSGGKDKVVVYFNKAIDSNTIANKNNYKFVNGEGDTMPLPADAIISSGGDNKSAIIEFPPTYQVITNSAPTTNKSNDVTALIVSNIKDEAGNVLADVAYKSKISAPVAGTNVRENTLKTYYDGDDLKVEVTFTRAVDETNFKDFTLGGVTPTSARPDGDKVILTFKDEYEATAAEISAHPITYANGKINTKPTKIDIIKAQGINAKLAINSTTTKDETGAKVSINDDGSAATLSKEQSTIYSYQASPRTAPDYWSANKDSNGGTVYMTFDTPLDPNSGIKSDDFMFACNGIVIKADSIQIVGNTVVLKFNTNNKNYAKFTQTLDVRFKRTSASLRTIKDADGNYSNYILSLDDLKKRTIYINK